MARRARILGPWLIGALAAAWLVARAHYITDLSAFLPANPTPLQQLLVDQLREGPASRSILIALEDGTAQIRARLSTAMARRLRREPEFVRVDNGEPVSAERDREFLFGHRYALSDAVDARRFSAPGLHAAIENSLEDLASSAGLMVESLVPRDPTGEMLHLLDQLSGNHAPASQDGVWTSADSVRAVLVAATAAPGSDTDAQERALAAVTRAYEASRADLGAAAAAVRLRMSGPGVFAVEARATIKRAATRLSIVSSVLIIVILLAAYRSVAALGLGLLPVATGALAGIAAVALGFGAVHGITLGFGITLIGESVDYAVYFFIQSRGASGLGQAAVSWQRSLWPTVRLGMLTSVCGFASLLPSSFPGLAQLGLYSISGLAAAALVTRFVLPELLPRHLEIRDLTPLGAWLDRRRESIRRRTGLVTAVAVTLALAAAAALIDHRGALWASELSALSPVPPAEQRLDSMLRADLGAADVLDIVIVQGPTLESVLRGAEHAAIPLRALIESGAIGGFDTPAQFLPSTSAQRARLDALPDRRRLEQNLQLAVQDLDIDEARLEPFIDDVEAARHAPPAIQSDLSGTSLAAGFEALILHRSGRWSALLPLHAAAGSVPPDIDTARVRAALSAAHLTDTQLLDMKAETDDLYAGYLGEAIRLSLWGLAIIVLLLLGALRSPWRAGRVLAPLVLAVLCVGAGLAFARRELTILHLVGMLLIVAVGSNYALFFDSEPDRRRDRTFALTLASLGIANLATVIAFGLLSFSKVPVLEALGETVAPGTLLALVFSALLTSRAPPLPEGAHA